MEQAFKYRDRLKWAAFRLFAYTSLGLAVISCGTLFYIVAPLTSYIFFGTAAFWRHIGDFHRVFLTCLHFIRNSVASPFTGYRITLHLFSPPMMGPDPQIARVSPSWPHGSVGCNGCHTCCDKFRCALVGEDGGCICYGSLFWRYSNCGRFPEYVKQLEFYNCPKWILVKNAAVPT